MTRFTRNANGKYVVQGKTYDMLIGSRAQVWHETAYKTSGELKKSDLMQNKSGRIVSKSKHHTAKKENRLVKAGYGTKKGKFGFVKLSSRKSSRGGASSGSSSGGLIGQIKNAVTGTSSNSSTMKMPPKMMSKMMPSSSSSSSSKPSMSSSSGKRGGRGASLNTAYGNSGRRGGSKRKQRGGHLALSPAKYDSAHNGGHTSGVNLQFVAGNAG
jgi:hypothetical protein